MWHLIPFSFFCLFLSFFLSFFFFSLFLYFSSLFLPGFRAPYQIPPFPFFLLPHGQLPLILLLYFLFPPFQPKASSRKSPLPAAHCHMRQPDRSPASSSFFVADAPSLLEKEATRRCGETTISPYSGHLLRRSWCQSTHLNFLFKMVPYVYDENAQIIGMYFHAKLEILQVDLSQTKPYFKVTIMNSYS